MDVDTENTEQIAEETEDSPEMNLDTAFSDALENASPDSDATSGEAEAGDSGHSEPPVEAAEPSADESPVAKTPDATEGTAAQDNETLNELFSKATELGISTEGLETESQVAEALISQITAMQPYVQYAQQLLPHATQIRDFLNPQTSSQATPQKEQAQQEPAPEGEGEWSEQSYFQEKYGGTPWKDEFQQAIDAGLVARNPETGTWQPTPGNEISAADFVGEMNSAQQHSSTFWQNIATSNPYQNFYEALKEPMLREMESRVASIMETREAEAAQNSVIDDFQSKNANWLYGTDPSTGQSYTTEQGEKFFGIIDQLREKGMNDPRDLLEYAQLKFLQLGGQPPVAPSEPAAQQQAAPTETTPSQTEQPKEAFLDSALKRAAHSPSSTGTATDAPQAVTDGDLDSMFMRAFRSAQNN